MIDGQALYDRVEAQLQHQYPLISIGWVNHDTPFINWSQPNLKQAAKILITAGAQAILFKPLGWVTENASREQREKVRSNRNWAFAST